MQLANTGPAGKKAVKTEVGRYTDLETSKHPH